MLVQNYSGADLLRNYILTADQQIQVEDVISAILRSLRRMAGHEALPPGGSSGFLASRRLVLPFLDGLKLFLLFYFSTALPGEHFMVRRWLETAIEADYLPVIRALEDTPEGRHQAEELNQRIRHDWDEHGAKKLTQKQGLSDELRRYLKDKLGDDHWVLGYVGLTTQEYAEINDRKQGRVAERNEATQQLENPDAIVAKAVELIGRPEWENIAAGLAVLTGRRVAEVLSTAQFEKKSQWSVTFTGALKRRGEKGLEFEIPTLATADRVIGALAKLRGELPEAVGMDAKAINRKYEQAVAQACDRAFSGLVPSREGKDSLYTHLFRAVYATIASFWYCPPSVNETEFRAAIQGHYAIQKAKGEELRRSLAASRHYADYEIADKEVAYHKGKRKGIRLGVGGVQPIEMFREAWEKGVEPKPLGERKGRSSFRVWLDDKHRLDQLLEPFEGNQQEKFHAFLNWLEEQQNLAIPLTESSEGEAEVEETADDVIPMQIQDPADLDGVYPVEDQAIAPSTDSKIDRLIDTMEQLIALQLAQVTQQTQAAQTAKARRDRSEKKAKSEVAPDQAEASSEKPVRSPQPRAAAVVTAERLNQAIDAIFAFNDAPERRHQEKWAIGINTLKAFVKSQEAIVGAIGGRNRKGEIVQGTRQQEIEAHHQKHQIDPDKHNYYHRGKQTVDQVVKLG